MYSSSFAFSEFQTIARQCFVFGGPSVFLARSMYYTAIGTVDNSFQDYCLENFGSYKTEPTHNKPSAHVYVYPNPANNQYGFFVVSNYNASGFLANNIGQIVKTVVIGEGLSTIGTGDLTPGIYQLTLVTESGETVTHRLILQ